jgi:GGDEF domain-containing protein
MDDAQRGWDAERKAMPPVEVMIRVGGEDHAVELPEETVRALTEIAERNGQTLETALQQAIVNENRIEDALGDEGKLLLEKNGKLQELFYEVA